MEAGVGGKTQPRTRNPLAMNQKLCAPGSRAVTPRRAGSRSWVRGKPDFVLQMLAPCLPGWRSITAREVPEPRGATATSTSLRGDRCF